MVNKNSNNNEPEENSKFIRSLYRLSKYNDENLDYIYSHEHDAYNDELGITTSQKNSLHFHLAILGITATVGITILFTILTIDGISIVGTDNSLLSWISVVFSLNIFILFVTLYVSYTYIDIFTNRKSIVSSMSETVKNIVIQNPNIVDFHDIRVVDCFILIAKRKIQRIVNADTEKVLSRILLPQYIFIILFIVSTIQLFWGVLDANELSTIPQSYLITVLCLMCVSLFISIIYMILELRRRMTGMKSISDKIDRVIDSPLDYCESD